MKAILDSPDLQLDGFLGPGHVSTVVGIRPFEFVTRTYDKPVVVVGFEPLDILQGVHMIIRQVLEGRCEVENQYKRVVHDDGNPKALEVLARVFKLRSHFEWRGLGFISQSALELQDEYADYDAEKVFSVPGVRVADPKGVPVRRSPQGSAQALGMQGVRHRVHAGDTDRHLHGVVRRRVRRLLQLRAILACSRSRAGARRRGARRTGTATATAAAPPTECIRSRCARDERDDRRTRQWRGDQGGVGAHRRSRAARARAHRGDPQAPSVASRGRHHDESRRRGQGQPHAGHGPLRRHPQQPGARPARRPGGTGDPGRRAPRPRGHDGLVRGQPALLSGWRHRRACGQRHDQRPRRRWRNATRDLGCVHPRGRPRCRDTAQGRRVDASAPRTAPASAS